MEKELSHLGVFDLKEKKLGYPPFKLIYIIVGDMYVISCFIKLYIIYDKIGDLFYIISCFIKLYII